MTGSFEMNFGQAVLTPGAASRLRMRRRGWLKDIGNSIGDAVDSVGDAIGDVADDVADVASGVIDAVGDVGNALIGNVDFSKSLSFSVAAGTPNTVTNIYSDKM